MIIDHRSNNKRSQIMNTCSELYFLSYFPTRTIAQKRNLNQYPSMRFHDDHWSHRSKRLKKYFETRVIKIETGRTGGSSRKQDLPPPPPPFFHIVIERLIARWRNSFERLQDIIVRQLAGETRAGESIPFIKFVTFRFITIQSRGNGGSALRGDKRRGSRRPNPRLFSYYVTRQTQLDSL